MQGKVGSIKYHLLKSKPTKITVVLHHNKNKPNKY